MYFFCNLIPENSGKGWQAAELLDFQDISVVASHLNSCLLGLLTNEICLIVAKSFNRLRNQAHSCSHILDRRAQDTLICSNKDQQRA